ncbi:AMP-binding protein [Actinoalloteichus sp. AHMU CJ021]|uniref:AMP-binding protein n=1 Tax=Actinoalloteichus sp. AHMU CJ021 TaxID=2072503 RepID=UPI00307C4D89
MNLVLWHGSVSPTGLRVRTAQFSAISFDASATEILSTLHRGGCLVMPDEQTRRSPERFVRWLEDNRVSELHAPNAMVDAVCEAAAEEGLRLPTLVEIAQAGEAFVLSDRIAVVAARAAGFRTALIRRGPWGHLWADDPLVRRDAEWVIDSIHDLPGLLFSR